MNQANSILLSLLLFLTVKAQNKIKIDDIILIQKDNYQLELQIPKSGLDTGNFNKSKRIAVYENNLLEIKTKNGAREIISHPIYSLEGFCNSSKSDFNSTININAKEYFLEVSYIYPDCSKLIQTKSLSITKHKQ
jgi:hypothetical protein